MVLDKLKGSLVMQLACLQIRVIYSMGDYEFHSGKVAHSSITS